MGKINKDSSHRQLLSKMKVIRPPKSLKAKENYFNNNLTDTEKKNTSKTNGIVVDVDLWVRPFEQIKAGTHFRIAPKPRILWFKCDHGISINDDTFKMILFKDDAPCVIEA